MQKTQASLALLALINLSGVATGDSGAASQSLIANAAHRIL